MGYHTQQSLFKIVFLSKSSKSFENTLLTFSSFFSGTSGTSSFLEVLLSSCSSSSSSSSQPKAVLNVAAAADEDAAAPDLPIVADAPTEADVDPRLDCAPADPAFPTAVPPASASADALESALAFSPMALELVNAVDSPVCLTPLKRASIVVWNDPEDIPSPMTEEPDSVPIDPAPAPN